MVRRRQVADRFLNLHRTDEKRPGRSASGVFILRETFEPKRCQFESKQIFVIDFVAIRS